MINLDCEKSGELKKTLPDLVVVCHDYSFARVISIVETILDLFSPSRGGISAVPIAILLTFSSLMKRLLVISATSTAVVIAWPRAFRVIAFSTPEEKAVMIAST